jgi:energy-converting hydrogenase Eha subunit C
VISGHRETPILALCVLGAALSIASGAIHVHLWNEYYRNIKTGHMNVLFLFQWILCFVGAAAVLVMRNVLATVATGLLLAGTFLGYLLARYHGGGLFGFALPSNFGSWEATWSMVVEIIGTVVLLATAALMAKGRRTA